VHHIFCQCFQIVVYCSPTTKKLSFIDYNCCSGDALRCHDAVTYHHRNLAIAVPRCISTHPSIIWSSVSACLYLESKRFCLCFLSSSLAMNPSATQNDTYVGCSVFCVLLCCVVFCFATQQNTTQHKQETRDGRFNKTRTSLYASFFLRHVWGKHTYTHALHSQLHIVTLALSSSSIRKNK